MIVLSGAEKVNAHADKLAVTSMIQQQMRKWTGQIQQTSFTFTSLTSIVVPEKEQAQQDSQTGWPFFFFKETATGKRLMTTGIVPRALTTQEGHVTKEAKVTLFIQTK